MIELDRFRERPRRCPYLPDRTAVLEYRLIVRMSDEQYEGLLQRGWRRFGISFFRPACPGCTQCRSLRVDVAAFRPSRSQRRAMKRNAAVRVVVGRPTVTEAHVRLYNAYHADMHRRKGWPLETTNAQEYGAAFLAGDWSFARQFLYYDGSRLVGVALADVTGQSLSSVYFFHDPAWRPAGPGVFSIVQQLTHARQWGLAYQYLGYWIADCPSMAYKAAYRPHELLVGYPDDDQPPVWKPHVM